MSLVRAASDAATFGVTAEAIPGGTVLRFNIDPRLRRQIESFYVARSSVPMMITDLSTAAYTQMPYYHDWYKDYFYRDDVGKTVYYHVEAWDKHGVIAYSWPLWVSWKVRMQPPTGIMLTPSAYRRIPLYESDASGTEHVLPINWDVTLSYYIGRLYGYNKLEELTTTRKNLFSRIGVSFLQTDVKFILERETGQVPQIALGLEGASMLRDVGAPSVANPTAEFQIKKENQRLFGGLYVAASKEIGWIRPTVGWVRGNSMSKLIYLTEFLPKSSESDSGVFVNMSVGANSRYAFQWEYLRPLRARGAPWMINAQLGKMLHANFDLAYLHYERGYEILAHLSFRLTIYPGSGKK